jgi:hypothetical protein
MDAVAARQSGIDHTHVIEDLECSGLNCNGSGIFRGSGILIDDAAANVVAGKLGCERQANGTRADDDDLGFSVVPLARRSVGLRVSNR